MRLTELCVEGGYQEVFPLLASSPGLVEDEKLIVTCYRDVDLIDLEQALAQLQDDAELHFQLELCAEGAVSFSNPERLRERLYGGLTWNTLHTSTGEVSTLVRDNHNLHELRILHPTSAALEITASLGASLRRLVLCEGEVTDKQLSIIGSSCIKLESFFSSQLDGDLIKGVMALTEGCSALRSVGVHCNVSDAAVTVLCTHCPRLDNLNVRQGFLTTAAL
jgi:hypothetical protein